LGLGQNSQCKDRRQAQCEPNSKFGESGSKTKFVVLETILP